MELLEVKRAEIGVLQTADCFELGGFVHLHTPCNLGLAADASG
jgi:hypothetical protein